MPELLTQAWLDAQRAASAGFAERPGATATIEYQVTGVEEGDVVFHTVIEDGRIVASAFGPHDDVDFRMIQPLAEYRAVLSGELDANVGFMQGRIKVTGNIGRMLSVLPVTGSDEWRGAMAELWAATTLGGG